MPGSESLSVCSAWKDRLTTTAFSVYFPDHELRLSEAAWALVRKVSREYHRREYIKKKKGSVFASFDFAFRYSRDPSAYPDLLHPDSFLPGGFTGSMPGKLLEDNFFLGYFRKLVTSEGRYFPDIFGYPIEPLPPLIDIVVRTVDFFVTRLHWGEPGEINLSKERLIACRGDLRKVLELFDTASELVEIARGERLQGLRTGHMVAFLSGLYPFLLYIRELIVQMGLVTITAEGLPPLVPVLDRLAERLRWMLLAMTAELMEPVLHLMESRLAMKDGAIVIERVRTPRRGLLGKVLDWFFGLFQPKRPEKPETARKKSDDGGEKRDDVEEKTPETVAPPVTSAPEPAFDDPKIDCGALIDIQEMLLRFNQMLKSELSPEYYENGAIKAFKAGFDQWDIPPERRRVDYSRCVLSGKLIVNNAADSRMGDQTIIDATYWLYDRVNALNAVCEFRREGTGYWKSKRFLEELKTIIVPQRGETDSIRRFATFQQFRTSVRRLFGSNIAHSRYYNLLNQLSDTVERALKRLLDEEERLKKDGKI
jgi:hypothetical protein